MPSTGGTPKLLTEALDRGVSSPVFSKDGASIFVAVDDDRAQYIARVPVAGGKVEPVTSGHRTVNSLSLGRRRQRRRDGVHVRCAGRSLRTRERSTAQAVCPEPLDRGRGVLDSRGRELHGEGRQCRQRTPRQAGQCTGGKAADGPLHSRRAGRPGRLQLRQHARDPGGQRLRRAPDELSRRLGARHEVPEGDLRRLGQPRGRGPAGRRRWRDQVRRCRPESARHLRLELRWHPHRLHDRDRHAVQGRHLRRQLRASAHDVRRRPVHRPVRRGARGSRGSTRTCG